MWDDRSDNDEPRNNTASFVLELRRDVDRENRD